MLDISLKIGGLHTIIECPTELRRDIAKYSDAQSLRINCTMQLLCPPLSEEARSLEDYRNYQVHEDNPEAEAMCEIKLKINVVRNPTVSETREDNPCTGFAHRQHLLLPHSTNCSLVSFLTGKRSTSLKNLQREREGQRSLLFWLFHLSFINATGVCRCCSSARRTCASTPLSKCAIGPGKPPAIHPGLIAHDRSHNAQLTTT